MVNHLWTRNFAGLFLAQFLGALNDNLFKVAIVTLWAVSGDDLPLKPEILAVLAGAVFILPFAVFVKPSGYLTDQHNRARLIQGIKVLECVIMTSAAFLFLYGQGGYVTYAFLAVLFLMGTQSALFGPVKYAILPHMVRGDGLMRANALIEGSTFVSILLGMLLGAFLVETEQVHIVAALLLFIAAAGLFGTFLISPDGMRPEGTRRSEQNKAFSKHFKEFLSVPRNAALTYSLAWFWAIGTLLVTQLPIIALKISDAPGFSTLFLAILVIGIAVGNGTIAYLSTKFAAKRLLSFSVVAYTVMTVLLLDFAYVTGQILTLEVSDITAFISVSIGAHFILVLAAIAICAGIFSVPLYTALLQISSNASLGKNFALNNFCQSLLIVATSALVVVLLFYFDLSQIFLFLAFVHLLGIPVVILASGKGLSRGIIRWVFRLLYRIRISGLEHYPVQRKEGLLIVSNHISYLDAPLLLGFLPRKPVFVIDKQVMKLWWVRIWLGACKVYPVDTESPFALKTVIRALQAGEHVVVFPEGALSRTGRLGKIYAGAGVAAHRTGAPILGVCISGLELTCFGRMDSSPRRLFARVSMNLMPPQNLDIPRGITGRDKRHYILDELSLLMREVMFQSSPYRQHIYQQLLSSAGDFGLGREVVDDLQPGALTYGRLLIGSQILAKKFAPLAPRGSGIGILLPNSKAAVTSFFAIQAIDRIAVMLNFTAGLANLQAAIEIAAIRNIVTSRLFIEKAGLEELVRDLSGHVGIIYLEDIRDQIGVFLKLSTAIRVRAGFIPKPKARFSDTAVILFTSGSEGTPKGVALSHSNVLANVHQALAAADFSAADRTFNPLPMFHCFGLTAGTLLPILSGGRSFQFPTPLRYRQVVELIYHWRATILFGANSFLQRYGDVAAPQDLQSLRYVFAGAEPLKDETYQQWQHKFGVQIFQGYGVTEASPVIAVNTRAFHCYGTVGLPVAGLECDLSPVPEMPEPNIGVLQVRGPNVMQGYIKADRPGVIVPLPQGWYDTGDIVEIDTDLYIRILGRQKRFAKIAGEMISLAAVEEHIARLWPEHTHAVLQQPHPKRGEALVLFTENRYARREDIIAMLDRGGFSPLMLPGDIRYVPEIPLLGSGKIDYMRLRTLIHP